ncbi:uncharacterized protein [Amphiura filiformis]|uniref:uncharacterized protein isoform X2 n=1 Tax=Amphiura filiformis TaxID=82378 RepID=UPI003B20FB7F
MAIISDEQERLPYKRLPSLTETTTEENLPGYVQLPPITPRAITKQPENSAAVVYTKNADGKLEEEVSIRDGKRNSIDEADEKVETVQKFYEKSVEIRCPRCAILGNSVTKKRPGLGVLGHMGLLCAVGLFPVFFLPLCCKKTYDTVHYCSVCDTKLGRYSKRTCMTEDDLLELELNR